MLQDDRIPQCQKIQGREAVETICSLLHFQTCQIGHRTLQGRATLPTKPKSNNQRTMEQITIAVGANRDNIEDTDVNVRVDATTSIWRNEITIWFDNGDYCDINIRTFHQTGRYLTTYLNVHAVDVFIDKLKKMV